MEKFEKLVRDHIPQIIEKDGRKAEYHVLSDENYLVELDNKLMEEVTEYLEDKSLEEMADILKVLYAICKARGYSKTKLEAKRKEKAAARGGFNKKIFLEYVDNQPADESSQISDMAAVKKWSRISDQMREVLVHNVYCSKCGVTTMVNYSVHSDEMGLVLKGKCAACGGAVVRVVEENT